MDRETELRSILQKWHDRQPFNDSPNFSVGDCVEFYSPSASYGEHSTEPITVSTTPDSITQAVVIEVRANSRFLIKFEDVSGVRKEEYEGKFLFPCSGS